MKNIAIIGGGISGVTTAYFLDRLASSKSKKINIDIIEKNSEFAKDKLNKFQYGQEIYDSGWHNSINNNSVLFQFMLELGLYRYLIKSKNTSKVIYTKSGLKNIPKKMLFGYPLDRNELLASDLLSFKDKISILFGLYNKFNFRNLSIISVKDFFINNTNSKFYNKIVEPILTSHYGSDISNQSLSLVITQLAFATIKNSDIKNVIENMYSNNVVDNITSGYEYILKFTLRSFLENIESNLGNKVFTEFNNEVTNIEKEDGKYALTIGNKKRYYDYVIISVKHTEFLEWFKEDRKLINYYKDLKFISNIVITIICKKDSLMINPEIGEIIFDKQVDSFITNVEYVSNKWVEIKSKNIHMLRVYVKRQSKVNELINKSDKEIENIISNELKSIHKNFTFEKMYINKIENNYMYADIKYSKYIHEIGEYLARAYDRIYFIGNSKKAINLENTILEARETAKNLIELI
ncbi:FAD-dependent oxidoreductase [Gemella sp. zg-1178]|uniref:FAD-dependent oxidoreductase n=1 Tax=Gemella sp. zg-1178 TaxID=2840372 RepID=UPI001C04FEEE|nr:FAD-dependent oxidoreductase [Gemella sp. zg-1178]MBU0278076.1 FAD-dependent oxidoreductase [Gemella sp. zg-1178]